MFSFKKKKPISYSDLLIEFIDPILTGEEDEAEILEKAKAGMTAWNFAVSDQAGLAANPQIKEILHTYLSQAPAWLKEIIDQLVIRKNTRYSQHDQYLMTVDMKRKPDGSVTLYVESTPVEVLKAMGG